MATVNVSLVAGKQALVQSRTRLMSDADDRRMPNSRNHTPPEELLEKLQKASL